MIKIPRFNNLTGRGSKFLQNTRFMSAKFLQRNLHLRSIRILWSLQIFTQVTFCELIQEHANVRAEEL